MARDGGFVPAHKVSPRLAGPSPIEFGYEPNGVRKPNPSIDKFSNSERHGSHPNGPQTGRQEFFYFLSSRSGDWACKIVIRKQ